jgi:hypothetical protein
MLDARGEDNVLMNAILERQGGRVKKGLSNQESGTEENMFSLKCASCT